MRDLGVMGESTFTLWCADAGLISNGSQIDKTGWDFFVEFPFSPDLSPNQIHKSALECKVQVKATDINNRKISITLSNLRRLITAQMPAFFVFIEFDGKSFAQRAFVVHVDNCLITKVLKRLHELEQSNEESNLNKRTMTIHYDETNLLDEASGDSLKRRFNSYIGGDIEKYIENKKSHLESTGYENGFAQITFVTEGEDNLKSLIDVSLGLESETDISRLKGFDTRFGVLSSKPFVDLDGGKLKMPDIKPTAKGMIRFREKSLSPALSFGAKFYYSPFNKIMPDDLKKIRVEGDFFDLIFNPCTGAASYSFSFGEGIRMEVSQFRDAIKLLNLLCSSDKKMYAELVFDGFPVIKFNVGCKGEEFNFSDELRALNSAIKLMLEFDVTETVDISFDEVSRYQSHICQLEQIFLTPHNLFKIEYRIEGEGYDLSKETACVFFVSAPVGSHVFGVLLVLIGRPNMLDNGKYQLIAKEAIIEEKIISGRDQSIPKEELVNIIHSIEERYDADYSVVTMFDKGI